MKIILVEVSNKTIEEIAESLEMGLSCFLKKETGQLVAIPKEIDFLDEHFDIAHSEEFEAWEEDINIIKASPDSFIRIPDMTTSEAFSLMGDFIETVTDPRIKDRFLLAIKKPKPFAQFKAEIDRSESYRDRWFKFRKQQMINWVKLQIEES